MNKLYKIIHQTYTRKSHELNSKLNYLKFYFMFSPRSLLKKYFYQPQNNVCIMILLYDRETEYYIRNSTLLKYIARGNITCMYSLQLESR